VLHRQVRAGVTSVCTTGVASRRVEVKSRLIDIVSIEADIASCQTEVVLVIPDTR
jgi:hypothetical protein